MAGSKRAVPVEVVERAEALTKRYTVAPAPKPVAAPPASASAEAKKKKVVQALKRLHPMD